MESNDTNTNEQQQQQQQQQDEGEEMFPKKECKSQLLLTTLTHVYR